MRDLVDLGGDEADCGENNPKAEVVSQNGYYCVMVGNNCVAQYETKPRAVPLTPQARRLIERMRGFDAVRVFGVRAQTIDALFRRARENAGLEGFTFHDARHTAATWLARRLDVLDLCKMFGWRDPKRAMTYYNPTASEIARRLKKNKKSA